MSECGSEIAAHVLGRIINRTGKGISLLVVIGHHAPKALLILCKTLFCVCVLVILLREGLPGGPTHDPRLAHPCQ
jgi:hypothetical protein